MVEERNPVARPGPDRIAVNLPQGLLAQQEIAGFRQLVAGVGVKGMDQLGGPGPSQGHAYGRGQGQQEVHAGQQGEQGRRHPQEAGMLPDEPLIAGAPTVVSPVVCFITAGSLSPCFHKVNPLHTG